MGDNHYNVVSGNIYFDNTLINDLTVDERARLGIFLGMQMPLEIDGVTNADFLRAALYAKEKENFKLYNFIKKLDKNVENLKMSKDMIHRGVNKGFSGGERKKNDSLKVVGEKVMEYYREFNPSILVITHYQRLLHYIKPDFVHIMKDGNIIKSGDYSLVKIVEDNGYEFFTNISENIIEDK